MSFGAGHIQDMNNRIKQNRSMRPSKRSKFKENHRNNIGVVSKQSKTSNFKTVSKESLKEIKKEIRKKAKLRQKKINIISVLLLIFCLTILVKLIIWLN